MITILLIVINVIVTLIAFNSVKILNTFILHPYTMKQNPIQMYRFITSGFIHADVAHLLFNMISLFFMGLVLETRYIGSLNYLFLYLFGLIFSAIPTYFKHKENPSYYALGASGAISAVVFSSLIFGPWELIYLKFFIPIYFILYAFIYVGYSIYQGKQNNDNIAHDVHLYGALFGMIFTFVTNDNSFNFFIHQLTHPPFL